MEETLTYAEMWELWGKGFAFAMGFIAFKIFIRVIMRINRPSAPEI